MVSGQKIAVLTADELHGIVSEAVQTGVRQALSGIEKDVPSEMGEKKAAEYLGVAPATLRTWRALKKGPTYHKSGRSVRYSRKDLEDWIKSSRVLTIDSLEVSRGTTC